MIRFTFFLILCLSNSACDRSVPTWKQRTLGLLSTEDRYFCEVALGSEFGRKYHKIRKWKEPLRIYLIGEEVPHLEMELDKIVDELNQLLPSTGILRVFEPAQANVTIFLGAGEEFARLQSIAKGKVNSNWGLVFIKQNQRGIIESAQIYVDVFRATNPFAQRHLLREEFTQALGLLNDSQRFPDSIFYQEWTLTNQYSELDKRLIRTLYRDDILVGMKLKEVVERLKF